MKHLTESINATILECGDPGDIEVLEFVRDHVIPAAFERDLKEAKIAFQEQIDNLKLGIEVLDGEILLIEDKLKEGDGWQ